MASRLILSLFPGLDLLGKGFQQEIEGCCVVHGPDLIWGWDVRGWHAPAGVFWGVIGGPPCKAFSRMRYVNAAKGFAPIHPNLIPELERIVGEVSPEWFLMENVPEAPAPVVDGYVVRELVLNNRWLGEVQRRERRFSFGTRDGRSLVAGLDVAIFESPEFEYAVMGTGSGLAGRKYDHNGYCRPKSTVERIKAAAKRPLGRLLELQGERPDMLDYSPFTRDGKREIVGQAVPLPMARAVARAVARAMGVAASEGGKEVIAGGVG